MRQLVLILPLSKAFSDSARAAALEARRAKMQNKTSSVAPAAESAAEQEMDPTKDPQFRRDYVRNVFMKKPSEESLLKIIKAGLATKELTGSDSRNEIEKALRKVGYKTWESKPLTDDLIDKALASLKKDPLEGESWKGAASNRMPSMFGYLSPEGKAKAADMLVEASKDPDRFKADPPDSMKIRANTTGAVYALQNAVQDFAGPLADKTVDAIGPEKVKEFAPYMNMYAKNYDDFKPAFVDTWVYDEARTGVMRRANVALADTPLGEGKRYYQGEKPLTAAEKAISPNMRENLQGIYKETQAYLKKKYATKENPNSDLSKEFVEVYRGVQNTGMTAYTPSPMESWTVDEKMARKFGKDLGGQSGLFQYTILKAKVPLSSVFMNMGSMKEAWPKDTKIRREKEWVILGAQIKDVSIENVNTEN